MNELKYLLSHIYVAILTSSWWTAGLFGNLDVDYEKTAYFLFWPLATILSVVYFIFWFKYCVDNWNKK